mgnify:CR=1 FL=1
MRGFQISFMLLQFLIVDLYANWRREQFCQGLCRCGRSRRGALSQECR